MGKKIWQLEFPGTGNSGSVCSISAVHTLGSPGDPPCSMCSAWVNFNAGVFPCSVGSQSQRVSPEGYKQGCQGPGVRRADGR